MTIRASRVFVGDRENYPHPGHSAVDDPDTAVIFSPHNCGENYWRANKK
jgi:hypothetical protein